MQAGIERKGKEEGGGGGEGGGTRPCRRIGSPAAGGMSPRSGVVPSEGRKPDTNLLRRQMDGEAAYDGDFQLHSLGAGGIVRVADVSAGVLDPGRLQHQHTGPRVDPLRVEDHRRARHGLAEPEIRGRRDTLRDA